MRILISLAMAGILYGLAFVEQIKLAHQFLYWLSWLDIFLMIFSYESIKKTIIDNGLGYIYTNLVVNMFIIYFMIKLNEPVIAVCTLLYTGLYLLAIKEIKEGKFNQKQNKRK